MSRDKYNYYIYKQTLRSFYTLSAYSSIFLTFTYKIHSVSKFHQNTTTTALCNKSCVTTWTAITFVKLTLFDKQINVVLFYLYLILESLKKINLVSNFNHCILYIFSS